MVLNTCKHQSNWSRLGMQWILLTDHGYDISSIIIVWNNIQEVEHQKMLDRYTCRPIIEQNGCSLVRDLDIRKVASVIVRHLKRLWIFGLYGAIQIRLPTYLPSNWYPYDNGNKFNGPNILIHQFLFHKLIQSWDCEICSRYSCTHYPYVFKFNFLGRLTRL